MNNTVKSIISWAIALWACKVFLFSLPYKFTGHPDTQHIFQTIGQWLSGFLGKGIGDLFENFGAYIIGSFELLTSLVLLAPAVIWVLRKLGGTSIHSARDKFHAYGGLMAAAVMSGAVFFHLVSPLGIEVMHEGQSDGGSLFYAALSILVLGLVLFALNARSAFGQKNAQSSGYS